MVYLVLHTSSLTLSLSLTPLRLCLPAVADCSWSVWFSFCLPSCQSATQRRRDTESSEGGREEMERSLALWLQIDAAIMHNVKPPAIAYVSLSNWKWEDWGCIHITEVEPKWINQISFFSQIRSDLIPDLMRRWSLTMRPQSQVTIHVLLFFSPQHYDILNIVLHLGK